MKKEKEEKADKSSALWKAVKKDRLDIMLDIETLGIQEKSVVLNLCAKSFTLSGNTPPSSFCLHRHISVLSSLWHRLKVDEGTLEWWRQQSQESKDAALAGQQEAVSVDEAMSDLYDLFNYYSGLYDIYIWGRGIGSFDLPLLDSIMSDCIENYKRPWKYWQVVDVRSVLNFCRQCGLKDERSPTPHDAKDDVEKQIREVQLCYQYVKVERAI